MTTLNVLAVIGLFTVVYWVVNIVNLFRQYRRDKEWYALYKEAVDTLEYMEADIRDGLSNKEYMELLYEKSNQIKRITRRMEEL